MAPKVSLVDQLAQINVKPEQIKYVGISHFHADHTGQLGSFPKATLLIGKGDWDGITAQAGRPARTSQAFAHWISGERQGRAARASTRTCSATAP